MQANNEYMMVAINEDFDTYSVLVSNDFERFWFTNSTEDPIYNVIDRVVC